MGVSPKRHRRCVGVSPHPSQAMCWARGARVGLEANKKANNFAGCLRATRTALDRKIIEPSKFNRPIDFSRHSWTMKWCPGAESNHRHCDFQSHALPTELPGRLPTSRRSGSRLIGGLAAPCPGRAPSNFGRGGEPSQGAPIAPRGLQYAAVETAMHRAATCDRR